MQVTQKIKVAAGGTVNIITAESYQETRPVNDLDVEEMVFKLLELFPEGDRLRQLTELAQDLAIRKFGSKSAAAQYLGLNRTTLTTRLTKQLTR